jgi:hypothetical protein
MDLPRILALEGGDHVEKLMRLVATVGVAMGAVDQLLQHQMAARMLSQVSAFKHAAEMVEVAVKIASNEEFAGAFDLDETPSSSRRASEGVYGSVQSPQQTFRIGHGRHQDKSCGARLFFHYAAAAAGCKRW